MAVVPTKRSDMINFFATRLPVWSQNPTAIGLTAQQMAQLSVRVTAAQGAAADQLALQAQAKAATEEANNQAAGLRSFGGNLVNTVRSFAETNDNPAVYALAQIPAPSAPTPAPAPSMPYDLKADIDNNGDVVLAYKADNAAPHTGVFFEIRRRLDGQSGFTLIGTSGVKTFTDNAIPPGTTNAIYTVTARRGDLSSPTSENIAVPFASGNNSHQASATAGSIKPQGQKGEVA